MDEKRLDENWAHDILYTAKATYFGSLADAFPSFNVAESLCYNLVIYFDFVAFIFIVANHCLISILFN